MAVCVHADQQQARGNVLAFCMHWDSACSCCPPATLPRPCTHARGLATCPHALQDAVVGRLKELVDDFKELLPLVEELGNPALRERHWMEVFAIVGAEMPPSDTGTGERGRHRQGERESATRSAVLHALVLAAATKECCHGCAACRLPGFAPFSIRQLLQFNLLEQLPRLQAVGATACKEAGLQKALTKMGADWQGMVLRVVEYKDTGTCVIGGTDEVQVMC